MGVTMRNMGFQSVSSAFALAVITAVTPCFAASEQRQQWHLPSQDLDSALRTIGRSTNREIIFSPDAVRGRQSVALDGSYTATEAVKILLRGSSLEVVDRDRTILIRERFPAALNDSTVSSESIVVTGSRIRGAPATSPVTTVGREEAQKEGRTDLGQVIRDLPQNFAGGQSPTIAGGGQGGFTNVSGSSTLNLRGLGPDASLTLINGHRVAFDSVLQGVDISAIPLAAIERVDIVTDGASALYGSDAVAGVANVVLRRRFDGLITSARLSSTTDGGGTTQQYSAVTGTSWSSGGVMVAADYQRATEITARQRPYTLNLSPDATLIPRQNQLSMVIAGQQKLSESLTFEIDGHFMHRTTGRCMAYVVTTSCYIQGSDVTSTVDSWSASPALQLDLGSGWNFRVQGTYSESDTSIATRFMVGGVEVALARPDYLNKLRSIEMGGEGPLFSLPGGEARLALGAGYRSNRLDTDSRRVVGGVETVVDIFSETRNVAFAYGELFLPFLAPQNEIKFMRKLQVVGALRYEDHKNIDRIATPKVGLVFSPLDGVDFKANWGKSFKVPTLYQTGQVSNAQLVLARAFNPTPESGLPLLYLYGGNRNLRPERATTWNTSLTLTPAFLPGFKAEFGYFKIGYRDRVASPISPLTSALLPLYSGFVEMSPSSEDVLAAIASVSGTFSNNTGSTFDPASVSAIVYNQLQNISSQKLHGFDASASYRFDIQNMGNISVKGSASYLDSSRKVTTDMAATDQAGLVFTPPHWRARLSGSWNLDNVTVSAVGAYVGKVKDERWEPIVNVGSFTTLDAIAVIRSSATSGLLSGIDWTVSVQNLFNKKPAYVRSTDAAAMHYDSTNQSTYGRVVSLALSKVW